MRKLALFYGIKNLKKLRYIQHFATKAMGLRNYAIIHLETMVNIVLFRMNLFNNVYMSNNFIHLGGIAINEKTIFYKHRFLRVNDILSINKIFFKKIFNIFYQRLTFTRRILKKKGFFFFHNRLITPKLILNSPKYLQVNYKVLHAIL
jgi:ribosomal protein S4